MVRTLFDSRNRSSLLQLFYLLLNFGASLFIATLIVRTTDLICYKDGGRTFLEQINRAPLSPSFSRIAILILFFLLLGVSLMRIRFRESLSNEVLVFTVLADTVICAVVLYLLNLSNKEILLFPVAGTILFVRGGQRKTVLILFVVGLYILLDPDFSYVPLLRVNLDQYINFRNEASRVSLYGAKSILQSLNYFCFILIVFVDIQSRIEENRRVQELNEALGQSLKELEVANVQLVEYSKRSEDSARVKERNRLAREIHDTVGHTLAGIELGLTACRKIPGDRTDLLLNQIDKVAELASQGSGDIRRSLNALKPDALERYAMIPAIRSIVEQINDCSDGIVCTLRQKGEPPRLIAQQEELIYRIVQEGITNAIRHGQGTDILVDLAFSDDHATVTVLDDGSGETPGKEGFGLTHLRQGVEFYRGHLELAGRETGGCRLSAELPLVRRSHD